MNENKVQEHVIVNWMDIHCNDSFKPKSRKAQQLSDATPNADLKTGTELNETDLDKLIDSTIEYVRKSLWSPMPVPRVRDLGMTMVNQIGYVVGKVLKIYASSNNETIRNYNKKLKEMENTVHKAKSLDEQIQINTRRLKKDEEKLDNPVFRLERLFPDGKVILVIGPCGWGKSLLCNRLMGNTKDASEMEDNAIYKVGNGMNSVTAELRKVTKQVNIVTSTNTLKHKFKLSVVDSPGQFDSEYKDEIGFNDLKEYFHACGGVTIFCIVFKFGERNNSNYQDLLKLYAKFWGKGFWKKCVFVITHCDRDSKKNIAKLDKSLNENIQLFREKVLEISNRLSKDVPIFEFGEENFETSVREIMLLINQDKYKNKYTCKNIKSPINELYKNIWKDIDELKEIIENVKKIEKELKDLKKKIDRYTFINSLQPFQTKNDNK